MTTETDEPTEAAAAPEAPEAEAADAADVAVAELYGRLGWQQVVLLWALRVVGALAIPWPRSSPCGPPSTTWTTARPTASWWPGWPS
jgi:hypothetical protein